MRDNCAPGLTFTPQRTLQPATLRFNHYDISDLWHSNDHRHRVLLSAISDLCELMKCVRSRDRATDSGSVRYKEERRDGMRQTLKRGRKSRRGQNSCFGRLVHPLIASASRRSRVCSRSFNSPRAFPMEYSFIFALAD